MSLLSVNGASVGDNKLGAEATLNPNAAEFVPSALRPRVSSISIPDASSRFAAAVPAPGKSTLDRAESSVSANSDEEAQQYWHNQLPDDITPDFKIMGIDENRDTNSLSFSNLSLSDVNEGSRYASSSSNGFMLKAQQGLSSEPLNGNGYPERLKHPYVEYSSPTSFQPSIAKPWEKQMVSSNQLLSRERHPYNGNSSQRFLADMSNEQLLLDNADVGPLEFLVSRFPGFPAERLAEFYLSSGRDLKRTIELLTQLEVDGGFNQNFNSKATSPANHRALDFPIQDGLGNPAADYHQNLIPYRSSVNDGTRLVRSSSIPSRGAMDYASTVRKVAPQDSSIWKYERNSLGAIIGSSRSPQVLASSYNSGRGKGIYGDNLLNRGSTHASPVWVENREAVANEYSEMLDEARDNARIRNAYFEQARQAALAGNKVLARELSVKGHMHTMPTKPSPAVALESIYRQRNPEMMQTNGRERIIDLHGLHVSEAIHVLKRELAVLRIAARSSDQHMLVYIHVGTRGSHTPAGLATAVQRYLLEEEGLSYSEPQPGLLRLVMY